jgi:3-oxoadipate enol-lactonase
MKDRYQTLGNGQEKVLVLHDFFASTESYQPLHPYLNQNKFTYAFFDLRGYGRSKNIKGNYTLEEITQDCLELAEHLNWNAFHVIGHSMTGLAIQHLNAIKPDAIKTATAITPVPATGSPIPEDFLQVIRAGVNGDDAIIRSIIHTASGERYNDAFLDFKLEQFRRNAVPEARLGYLKMFTENNISEQVSGLNTPYHVIFGGCDSEWHGRKIMEETFGVFFPNCTITEIPDASHYPMQETPILLTSHIEHFLNKHIQTPVLSS